MSKAATAMEGNGGEDSMGAEATDGVLRLPPRTGGTHARHTSWRGRRAESSVPFLSQTFGGFFRHSYYDLVVYCMLGYLDCLSFARVPVLSFWVPRVKPKTQPCF